MPGLYENLRPRDVDPDEWECWCHEYGRSVTNADVYEYNRWWVSKVKSDILASLVRPEEETRRRRRLGRWKTKQGLSLSDRRPDLIGSITDFGGLFFETPFGSHRTFVKEKGRKFAGVGHTVIVWHTNTDIWRAGKIRCKGGKEYDGAAFYASMAASFALLEDAERRGDRVTLLVGGRVVERGIDQVRSERNLKKKVKWMTRVFKPDGKIAYEFNPFDQAVNPTMLQPKVGAGDDAASIVRQVKAEDKNAWKTTLDPPNLFLVAGDPDGDRFARQFPGKKRNEVDTAWFGPLSAAFFHLKSTDYEKMKDLLLSVVPRAMGSDARIPLDWMLPAVYEAYLSTAREVRGMVIILSTLERPVKIYMIRHLLREMDRAADVVVVDFGILDLSPLFTEPEMTRNGRPLVKYVYVGDDIGHMTERVLKAIGGTVDGVPL